MAEVKLNPTIESIGGKAGNIVFFRRCGRQYARSYVIPKNPDTEYQRINRHFFAEAVRGWQALSRTDKEIYNVKARRRSCSGYNLFISLYLKKGKSRVRDTLIKSSAIKNPLHGDIPSHPFHTPPFQHGYRFDGTKIHQEIINLAPT